AGRSRPAARSQQAPLHHERWRLPQGTRAARDADALEPACRMNPVRLRRWLWLAAIAVPLAVFVAWANITNPKQFVSTLLNGVTLAALYFLVASGFTLVFGLMRNVNLAHGSLFLFGAYMGWVVGDATDNWFLAIAVGFAASALVGFLLQVSIFRF